MIKEKARIRNVASVENRSANWSGSSSSIGNSFYFFPWGILTGKLEYISSRSYFVMILNRSIWSLSKSNQLTLGWLGLSIVCFANYPFVATNVASRLSKPRLVACYLIAVRNNRFYVFFMWTVFQKKFP